MKNIEEKPVQEKENVGSIILVSLTTKEITEALDELNAYQREKILKKYKKKEKNSLKEQKENYYKIMPLGFKYAPKSAKKYREKLENKDNVTKMKWLQGLVSYNTDGTMNILHKDFKKTFCEDLTSTGVMILDHKEALKIAKLTGYNLGTDYNDGDNEEKMKKSDWYKVINIFSGNKGDTVEGRDLFRVMAGCDNRYWTASYNKDEKGKVLSDVVQIRLFDKASVDRGLYNVDGGNRVCGFKRTR